MRNEDMQYLVSKALRRAWQLGQTYCDQADSEYISHNKQADVTQARFHELIEETRVALAAVPADAPVVLPEPDEAVTEVIALVQSAMDSAMKAGERILEPDTFDEAFNEAKSKKSTIETNLRFLLATVSQKQSFRLSAYEQILRKALRYIEANSFGGTDTIALIDEVRALLATAAGLSAKGTTE